MTIEIGKLELEQIYHHAESVYPDECCGILIGKIAGDRKIVNAALCTINAWETQPASVASERERTQTSRYQIAPQDILHAQKSARALQLEIIGFFHSHPDTPAIPSECDRERAWEVYSYPIVSVVAGRVQAIASWVLDEDRVFRAEEIRLVESISTLD